jgi:hypothetical protein
MLVEKNNSTRLRRIWVRLQGTTAGAYLGYVPVDVTPGAKTSKVGELFFSTSLTQEPGRLRARSRHENQPKTVNR